MDFMRPHTPFNHALDAQLTPSYRHVDVGFNILSVESFDNQHVKIKSFDEHPEESRDEEIVQDKDENGASRHVVLQRTLARKEKYLLSAF